jgi:hypothetical protein
MRNKYMQWKLHDSSAINNCYWWRHWVQHRV